MNCYKQKHLLSKCILGLLPVSLEHYQVIRFHLKMLLYAVWKEVIYFGCGS